MVGELNIPIEIQQVLSAEQAWHYEVIPVELDNNELTLLVEGSRVDEALKLELQVLLGKEISLRSEDEMTIKKALGQYYRRNGASEIRNLDLGKGGDNQLVKILVDAKQIGSSDIHVEALDKKGRIRMRIDGHLVEKYSIKKEDYTSLLNKIKVGARLDIAEKRRPQDGRMQIKTLGYKLDIRVSTIPTLHGEKAVLRILGNDSVKTDLTKLGMTDAQLEAHLGAINRPSGLVLISGPTGSGKTTTLYASLNILNEDRRNIVTIEDPIEYTMDGVNQMQLHENIDVGFAEALRSFLRQDPDVIMVGEIRDKKTADMAIRAALTGHLVLSTIHTNSAWGTISRLIDMGVPAFLLSSTLNISIAQRLVRLLCVECKSLKAQSEKPLNVDGRIISGGFTAVGCEKCHYSGFSGRVAIYEHIPIDRRFSKAIRECQVDVEDLIEETGIISLREQAIHLVESGRTSLEEVFQLINSRVN